MSVKRVPTIDFDLSAAIWAAGRKAAERAKRSPRPAHGLTTKECLRLTQARLDIFARQTPSAARKAGVGWIKVRCGRCGACPAMRAREAI
jgi:hypothetical protein